MGKDKHAQRTKNNARPSSSGRTAEMLGTAPINPFMSFTSLKESMGVDEQMADSHLDPNFQVVLKKMNKKDGVTKLKALQEFSQLCGSSEPEQVIAILPFWPRLYSVLALDVEHRVREASHIAHRAVLTKVKRNIAPYLKQLSGPWFVAQCDTYAPAASAASVAFNETFPAKKMSEAIAFCQEEILNYIYENLIVHTPQTLCNAKTMTPEEIEAKYIRTITSSLQGYGLYLSRLTSDQLHSAEELNHRLVSDSKFWKFTKHPSPQVRSAWFTALNALCQHAQFLLSGEEKRIGQAVFGSLDENEATVLPVVWEAALVALVSIDELFEAVSFDKLFLPKLLKVCREGGKGSAAAIFPSLLPLLSKMPADIVKGATNFHQKFFASVKQGFSQRTVQLSLSESKAVANAFVECLQYVIQLNQDNENLCEELLKDQLLPCICETFVSYRRAYACDALYLSVSKLLQSWGRSVKGSPQQKLLRSFCSNLSQYMKNLALGETCPRVLENIPKDIASQSEEGTENKEDCSPNVEKAQLKDVLRSEVDFITCLLEKQKRPGKVKFADSELEEMTEGGPTEEEKSAPSDVTDSEIVTMGKSLCCCYILAAKELGCVDYLQPLVSLVSVLNSPTTYFDMAKAVNMLSEQQLFSELLINWLKPHNALFCRAAVALSMPLLKYLSIDEQNSLFDQLLADGTNVNQLLWLVEENISSNGVASNWLRNPDLAPTLKSLTEEATMSDRIITTWKLLSSGCKIGIDGDHIFCHSALRDIYDVLVSHLEEMWHSSSALPPWTSVASDTLLKLYSEQSPFLRCLPCPQEALSVAFEICLWEPTRSPDIDSLSTLWKSGAKVLARMHGSSSPIVLQLCSSFVKAALTLLYGRPLHSKNTLLHIASQFTEFIEIVTDCFSSVDGDQERRKTCSLLLTALFSISKTSDEGTSELRDILALHRNGLEWLADCVEPMHPGIDSSQSIPRGSLTELIGAGYWSAIVAFVLKKLSVPSLCESIDDDQEDILFSWDVFIDVFILASDVKYIAHHFASTELGSAVDQLTKDTEDTIVEIISSFKPMKAGQIHELLLERCDKIAAYDRAHKTWHTISSKIPHQKCEYWKIPAARDISLEDESLKNINLSPLDVFAENLLEQGLSEEVKPQVLFWLEAVHNLHIRYNGRLVSNHCISSCSLAVVHDTSRILKFLNAVVCRAPELLSGRNWDQVMIAMATWLHCAHESVREKANENDSASRMSIKTCAFIQGICKLFVSFNEVITKLQDGSIELVDSERGSLHESLPREWKDVFAGECEHKIFAIWTEIVEKIKPSEESPPIIALLDELGRALLRSSTAFLQPSKEAEVAYEPLLEYAPPYLLHSLGSVRLAAFHLLVKIVPHMVKRDAASLANVSSEEEGEAQVNSEERLSLLRFEDILLQAQTVVSTMLSDVKLGTSCTVRPFTDSYTYTSGYLLVWSLMLEMCKAAETELKCQYAIWLKNTSENCAETLLNNIFRLLPQEAFDVKLKKPLEYFSSRPKLSFRDSWTSALVEHLACDVLFGALCCLPALTRVWWTNSEPKLAALIDQVVSKHLSPFVCSAEMAAVAKMQDKAVENMTVRVHPAVREVVATYTVDDLAMELVVRLPSNHPLTPMIVEVGKRNAAAAVQWRQWLMQLTMFLTHQNGSLWDGLALWRNNVVRRYEGVEECYVCYCVLSGANYQLPKLSCRTCRKKFHTACLYKWFQTSNKSTCPICRNLF